MNPHFPNLPSMPSSSSSRHPHDLHLDPQAPILNQSGAIPPPSTAAETAAPSSSGGVVVTKNPKKRTRASRRAPTTVLTTDTTNFRAMVQEFTGVPSPPFSNGPSHSSLRRFDIFRSPPSSCGHNLDPLCNTFPSTAQKVRTFLSSSSPLSSSVMNHHSNIVTSMASPPMNFHSLPDLPLPMFPLETQNTHVRTFQSLMSQQNHQSVSSLGELNAMSPRSLRHDQDQERDRDHHHRLMTRQVNVPLPTPSTMLPEFERQQKGSENNTNVSSSASSFKGTATKICNPWIYHTD